MKRKKQKLSGAQKKKARLIRDADRRGNNVEGAVGNVGAELPSEEEGSDDEVVDQQSASSKKEKTQTADEAKENAGEEDGDAPADPYLLADAAYIQNDTRWRNKQRTLVFCSRGVTSRYRHLMENFRQLLPHCKTESKFEKSQNFQEINVVCELKSCNNCLFFEARKKQDLYMWLGRVPSGPTVKFQVLNVHTLGEIHLTGNCLLGSRPILSFDKKFDEHAHLQLIKMLFIQALGTPRNHPKQKPFHDHIMSFHYLDGRIWFRHYQVSPLTDEDVDDPERQTLTEIGPRFVLEPIRILGGAFGGPTLFLNQHYMSPTALRVEARKAFGDKYEKRQKAQKAMQERKDNKNLPPDELDEVFM